MKKQSNIIGATIFFTSAALILVVSFLVVAAVANGISSGRQGDKGKVIKKWVKTYNDQHGQGYEANFLTIEVKDGARADLRVDRSIYYAVKIGDLVTISKDGQSVFEIDLEDHHASQGTTDRPRGEARDRR